MKYFYPEIISSKLFLSLKPNDLIQIFELLFPNDISSMILYKSLRDWAAYTDQLNRKIIIEYLILKYIHHSNKFSNMENKLSELIEYQKNILHRLDDSSDLTKSSNCLTQSKSLNEQTLWLTESEETINSTKTHRHLWNIDRKRITTIAICCALKRDLKKMNQDFHEALHRFKQFDSTKNKYALIHTGKYIYAIGEYKTQMFKFDIISHEIQHIDGPYPGRIQFGLATTANRIILIGGLTNQGQSISSSITFDCKQEQWYSLPDVPLKYKQGVCLSGVCFINSYTIIVIGGLIMTHEGLIAMRRCFRLNLNNGKWLTIASCNEARGQPIVTYHSDTVYTIGGFRYIYDQYKRMKSINVTSIEQ